MTGLIYVAIVGLWAAVLIPMWLSRHDADEAHRRERHETALGTLARFRSTSSTPTTATQRAIRRRRVIGVTLAALCASGAAAWALGLAGVWVLVLPLVLLGLFVVVAVMAAGASRRQQDARVQSAERRRESRERQSDQREVARTTRATRAAPAPGQVPAQPRPRREVARAQVKRPHTRPVTPTTASTFEDLFDQTA